uniref:Minichromosome loss protein Mcl1 middle region domain-containing protein n=1 Tax=Ditylenchus dipsaci TaxID=166011 RepID=A0A915E3B1_9BILA
MPKQVQKSLELHRKVGIVTLAVDQISANNQLVYSCGTDENIGVWTAETKEGLVYTVQNCSNDLHGVLAVRGDTFYVGETIEDPITGNKKQAVVKYIKDEFQPSTPILTFTWEITALALSSDGRHLLAGSSDFKVKCVDLLEKDGFGFESFECEGHVVSLSIDPKCTFFAVSSSDGNIQVRTLARGSGNFKKPINVFKACSSFLHITCEVPRMQVSWLSTGSEKGLSAPNCLQETFSMTAISENDQFLVACTTRGTMAVWLIEGLQLYKTIDVSLDGIVTSMLFNPANDGSVVLAYSKGYLGMVKDATALKKCSKLDSPQRDNTISRISSSMSGSLHEEIGEFEDAETDLGLIKSQFGFTEDGQYNPTATVVHSNALTNPANNGLNNYSLNNGMNAPKVEPSTTIKKMKVQKPFGNGSTPSHHGQCYLVWNTFGVIKSFRTPDDSSIEIVFHDVTVHSEIIIDNAATNYSLGDLNNNLVALASCANSDRESELMVHHIGAFDVDSRQWSVKMTEGESVESVSVGSEFVALFTDKRFLRIFSSAGTQRNVISLAGSVLTMCAYSNKIVMVKSTGAVLITRDEEYEHQLSAELFVVNSISSSCSLSMLKSVPVALGEGSQLKWISFSNLGNMVAMDSLCTVRLFTSENFWQPIFSGSELLKDAEYDFVWPVAVMERPTAMFRYIYCRGSKYPLVNKNMIPLTVPWDIPVANSDAERSKLESQLIINEVMQSALKSSLKDDPCLLGVIAQIGQDNLKTLIKAYRSYVHTLQEVQDLIYPNGWLRLSSMASSSSVFDSVDTQLAPNSKLLPKKKTLQTKKPNISTTVNLDEPLSKDPYEEEESERIATNFPRLTPNYIDDSVMTDDSFSFFDAPSLPPTKESDIVVSAKNPFKRTKVTVTEEKVVNSTYSSGVDFFEQLTTKRAKLNESSSTTSANNLRDSCDGSKKSTKKQSKLAFSNSMDGSEAPLKDSSNGVVTSKRMTSAFDLWYEESKVVFLQSYEGPTEDFQKHMVRQFRMLTSQEKKKWNDAAKSS